MEKQLDNIKALYNKFGLQCEIEILDEGWNIKATDGTTPVGFKIPFDHMENIYIKEFPSTFTDSKLEEIITKSSLLSTFMTAAGYTHPQELTELDKIELNNKFLEITK